MGFLCSELCFRDHLFKFCLDEILLTRLILSPVGFEGRLGLLSYAGFPNQRFKNPAFLSLPEFHEGCSILWDNRNLLQHGQGHSDPSTTSSSAGIPGKLSLSQPAQLECAAASKPSSCIEPVW